MSDESEISNFSNFYELIWKIGFVHRESDDIFLIYEFKNYQIEIQYSVSDNFKVDNIIYVMKDDNQIYTGLISKYDELEKNLKAIFPHTFRKEKIFKILNNK